MLIFDGQHCECRFVGRQEQLELADTAWENGKQLFGVYGYKSVGKTRFAKEVILRHWHNGMSLYQLDGRGITTLNELVIHVATGVRLEQTVHVHNWQKVVCQCLKNRAGSKDIVVVFIENAEELDNIPELKTAFLTLCQMLVNASQSIKVIFTSSIRFRFIGVSKVTESIDVSELNLEESKELLRQVIGVTVHLGEYEDQILEHCTGLPLAIQIAGAELTEDGQQLTPEDLVTLLKLSKLDPLSREHYAQEEQMRYVIGGTIDRLSDIFQQYYASVIYIPGSFTQDAATSIMGFASRAVGVDKAMLPLHRRHLISFDRNTRRYDINPMQREYVMNNITIRDLLGVRSRYAKFFSDCLVQLQKVVDSKDSGKALIPLNLELRNFRKLLEDAAFCGNDGTFGVFVRAAMEATFLILYYMPDQSVSFYEVMLDTCREHGSEYDSGVLMSIFGEILSEQQGDYLKGKEWYHIAKSKLRPYGNSRRLAEIYQHMGWYYYVHGPGSKAVKNHMKSYNMLLALGLEDDLQTAKVENCLGIAYVSIGNAKEAEQYHTRSLATRLNHLGEKHLTIAMHYNNIGLMYDLKEDYEKAQYYFEKSYELKKELIGPSKTVILSMRNLGLQYIRKKEYRKALALAEENMATLEQVANRDKNTKVNILEIQSIAYVELGEYAKAEPLLREMYEVKKVATPGHSYNRMILKHLGRALRGQGKFQEALEVLTEAIDMGDTEGPGGFGPLAFELLQEMGYLGIDQGDMTKAVGYFQRAVENRHRWGDYNLKEDKIEKAEDAFRDLTSLIRKVAEKPYNINLVFPTPCSHENDACCIYLFSKPQSGFSVGETFPKSLCESPIGQEGTRAWVTENTLPIYVAPQYQRNPFGNTESVEKHTTNYSNPKSRGSFKHIEGSPQLLTSGSSPNPMQSGFTKPDSRIGVQQSSQIIYSPGPSTVTPQPEKSNKEYYNHFPDRSSPHGSSPEQSVLCATGTTDGGHYSQNETLQQQPPSSIPGQNLPVYVPPHLPTGSRGQSLSSSVGKEKDRSVDSIATPRLQRNTPLLSTSERQKGPTPLPPGQTRTDETAPSLTSGAFQQCQSLQGRSETPKAPTPLTKESSDDGKATFMASSGDVLLSYGRPKAPTPLPKQDSAEGKAPSLGSSNFQPCSEWPKAPTSLPKQDSTDKKAPSLSSGNFQPNSERPKAPTPLPKQDSTDAKAPSLSSGNFQASSERPKASTPLPKQDSTDGKAPSLSSGNFQASSERPKAPTPLPKQDSAAEKAPSLNSGVFQQHRSLQEIPNAPTPLPKQASIEEKAAVFDSLSTSSNDGRALFDSFIIRQHSETMTLPEQCSSGYWNRTEQSANFESHTVDSSQLQTTNVPRQWSLNTQAPTMNAPCPMVHAAHQQQANAPPPSRNTFSEYQVPIAQTGTSNAPMQTYAPSEPVVSNAQEMVPEHLSSITSGQGNYRFENVAGSREWYRQHSESSYSESSGQDSIRFEEWYRQRSESSYSESSEGAGSSPYQLCQPPTMIWRPPSGCPSLSSPSPTASPISAYPPGASNGPSVSSGPNLASQSSTENRHCVIDMD